jgi:hypothetical protein
VAVLGTALVHNDFLSTSPVLSTRDTVSKGSGVGDMDEVGDCVGLRVGSVVGACVGLRVGVPVGLGDGGALGAGERVGVELGERLFVGAAEILGASDGACDFLDFPLPL